MKKGQRKTAPESLVNQWRAWFVSGVSLREICRRSGWSFDMVSRNVGPYTTYEAKSRALTKHGRTTTPEWKSWNHMKSRCFTPTDHKYPDYGGRGITVCDRWRDSFENFLDDMGPKPSRKHTIDRIDNDGNYEPNNCRWATNREQCNNRRSNVILEFDGKRMNATQWAAELGLPPRLIAERVRRGWDAARVLTAPVRQIRENAVCHPERLHHAVGLCKACYQRSLANRPGRARRVRAKKLVTAQGITRPIGEWAASRGLHYRLVWKRLRSGWSPERALELLPVAAAAERIDEHRGAK